MGQFRPNFAKNGHFVFLSSLWGLMGNNVDRHRLIGNRVVDFQLVIIKLFFARCYG